MFTNSARWLILPAALALLACIVACGGRLRQKSPPVELPQAQAPDRGDRGQQAVRDHHAGFRSLSFAYDANGSRRERRGFVWYPSATPARPFNYSGQVGLVAADAAVAPGKHPLVVFSHGFLGAADQTIFLMEALARRGYVVAAINHADSAKAGEKITAPNFVDARSWTDRKYLDRKEDIGALLDHLLAEHRRDGSPFSGNIDEAAIGAAGHSLGGYTVLGMAGAWPTWRDERIRAVLLLSPYSTPFLSNGDLRGIKVPVHMQGGTLDWGITPFLDAVYNKLRSPRYVLVLKNETHFGWTNLISLNKTTTDCVRDGNAELMAAYSLAFFDRHLRGDRDRTEILTEPNERLWSYRFHVD